MDADTLKTVVDTGVGGVALLYAYRIGKLLEKHDTRLLKLEKRRAGPRSKAR